LAGVKTPLARAFLAIGSAVCEEDFMAKGRTLARLGLGGVGRAQLQALLAEGFKWARVRPLPASVPDAWRAALRWCLPTRVIACRSST
jgi:hypothetical protein